MEKSMNSLIAKAGVLIEALPYIRKFAGKTFVIKYGGHAISERGVEKFGNPGYCPFEIYRHQSYCCPRWRREITALMEKLGKKALFAGGLRVTDKETMEVVEMVLIGKINQEIVSLLNKHGGRAVGLSGKDSNLLMARKRPPVQVFVEGKEQSIDLGCVGDVVTVSPEVINTLSSNGYIPVISSVEG